MERVQPEDLGTHLAPLQHPRHDLRIRVARTRIAQKEEIHPQSLQNHLQILVQKPRLRQSHPQAVPAEQSQTEAGQGQRQKSK